MTKNKDFVKILIISHNRPDNVKTLKAIDNKRVSICIAESQLEAYKKNYPNVDYVLHPDSVIGLAEKYNWIYNEFKNVCIVADDIDVFRRNYLADSKGKKDYIAPELVPDLIQATAITGYNFGAKLCAWSKESNPLTYSGHNPFKITGLASGGVLIFLEGWKKFELSSRCTSGLDYYLSGMNAYFHRTLFIDNRFGVMCKEGTFVSQGGMADYRTIESERKDYKFLKELFGEAIQVKKNENLRKKKHQYEKTLKVPF